MREANVKVGLEQVPLTKVTCNECYRSVHLDPDHPRGLERSLAHIGWLSDGEVDLCKKCIARLEKEQLELAVGDPRLRRIIL